MGCIKSILSSPILQPVADVASIATGNPELIPLINAGITTGSNLANGQSIGKSLGQGAIAGGEGFAGNELAGAAANYFPETAASLGYTNTGGNSLTDLLGNTSGAGSLTGAGTIGGDVGNLFNGAYGTANSVGNSLSNLLTGSGAAPTGVDTTGDASFLSRAGSAAGASGLSPADSGFLANATNASGLAASPAPVSAGGGTSAYGTSGSGVMGSGLSPLSLGSSLLGAANTLNANDQAKKDLLSAQTQALGAIAPYSATGTAANSKLSDLLGTSGNTGAAGYGELTTPFTPGDLTQTPGYQFQLQQGDQALDRKAAAGGNYFSGSALKAAQDYGQGLAGETYNNAFAQDQQNKNQLYTALSGQSGAGQNAATTIGNIDTGTGNANAAAGISSANILNQTLSSLLSGAGARKPVYGSGGNVIGYA